MCKAWAWTPVAMGIRIGERVKSASGVIPRPAKASSGIQIGDAAFVMSIELLSLVTRVCGL